MILVLPKILLYMWLILSHGQNCMMNNTTKNCKMILKNYVFDVFIQAYINVCMLLLFSEQICSSENECSYDL